MSSVSIVVPTFERRALVPKAIDSALRWIDTLKGGEIIVVDDASTDGTAAYLGEIYVSHLASGQMRLIELPRNGGVTAAKNAGARLATHDWIVFLDSDDLLIAEAAQAVSNELKGSDAPVVFFRCVDLATGELIGQRPPETAEVDLRTLLSDWGWGECLPVVRRTAAIAFPYPAELRGYEGLAYARMVRAVAKARVSSVVARRYDAGDHARETTASRLSRWRRHKQYTGLMLTEFSQALSARMMMRYALSNLRARFDGVRAALAVGG